MMRLSSALFLLASLSAFLIGQILFQPDANATGMVPETSVVIVEASNGEGAINLQNSDSWPALLVTAIENLPGDDSHNIIVSPPVSRVEPGQIQRVRFLITGDKALQTEKLKRVTFHGIPPQMKGENSVRVSVRQNLPMIIRPANLPVDNAPWRHLEWRHDKSGLSVINPSPYIVRLMQSIETLPDKTVWSLPKAYILPGESLHIAVERNGKSVNAEKVRFMPASSWGYTSQPYEMPLTH
ncbi:fimbria/pilus chaperone family protein [Pantoea sp.]|uniref:fimbria/pilus chaperone family protein n=1 Tax=Pantoea sp. TaxID=69393 RepID=UPI0031E3D3A2